MRAGADALERELSALIASERDDELSPRIRLAVTRVGGRRIVPVWSLMCDWAKECEKPLLRVNEAGAIEFRREDGSVGVFSRTALAKRLGRMKR